MANVQGHDKVKQRLPAPSLFVAPSSHHTIKSASDNVTQGLIRQSQRDVREAEINASSSLPIEATSMNEHLVDSGHNMRWQNTSQASRARRVDDVWAEMQNTLEEVELDAASRANVFSASHARALEELRVAQISLAQAWARSENENDCLPQDPQPFAKARTEDNTRPQKIDTQENDYKQQPSSHITKKPSPQNDDARVMFGRISEDTAGADVRLAKQRRLANDHHFENINRAVVDVVSKLEAVAQKMRDVETESHEIWGSDKDSAENLS